jgi:broad specificity phosphatase PhoE
VITRLLLLAHAPTAAQRAFRFPDDESIEGLDAAAAKQLAVRIGPCSAAWCGPERRAMETAAALDLDVTHVAALRGWSAGSWAGRSVAEIAEHDPAGFEAWRTDPDATPGGGESLNALLARVASWMEESTTIKGHALVIADPTVIRAAVVHALDAGPSAFWRLEAPPLSLTILQRAAGQWRVRALNVEAREG